MQPGMSASDVARRAADAPVFMPKNLVNERRCGIPAVAERDYRMGARRPKANLTPWQSVPRRILANSGMMIQDRMISCAQVPQAQLQHGAVRDCPRFLCR